MLREEKLQCVKLLRHTLDVIQPIHANNDLHITESVLQLSNALLDALFLEILVREESSVLRYSRKSNTYLDERSRIDSDGESANVRQAIFEFYTVWHSRKPENTCTRGEEVAGVVISVETDQVAVKDTEQNLPSNWQNPKIRRSAHMSLCRYHKSIESDR